MKLKLTLSTAELQALIQIAGWLTKPHTSDDFGMYCYVTALEVFVIKHGQKFITGSVKRRKNHVTLTDMETLAFYNLLMSFCDTFQPFEYALSKQMIEAINKQHDREETLRQAIRNNKIYH